MGVVFHYSFIFCSKNNSMYNKYTKCINFLWLILFYAINLIHLHIN